MLQYAETYYPASAEASLPSTGAAAAPEDEDENARRRKILESLTQE